MPELECGDAIMPVWFAKRVSVPSDVLIREVGSESVILSLKSQRYWGLNQVGTRMWKAVTCSDSIQAAYDLLLAGYDVEAERLRWDLHDLVEKLVQQGLLQFGGPVVREAKSR